MRDWVYEYQERRAIIEFDAGKPRELANKEAREQIAQEMALEEGFSVEKADSHLCKILFRNFKETGEK